MFERVTKAAEAGTDLLEIKAERTLRAAERIASATAGFVLAGILGAAGLVGVLGAAYLLLEPSLTAPGALAVVSAAALVLAGAAWWISRAVARSGGKRRSARGLREAERSAAGTLRTAVGMGENDDADGEKSGASQRFRLPGLVKTVLDNGDIIGSAGFALVALLGPFKAIRLVSRSAALASLVAPLARAVEHASRDVSGAGSSPGDDGAARGRTAPHHTANGQATAADARSAERNGARESPQV